MTDNDQKELFKQAIKEWMDEKYADVGRWFVKKLLVAAVVSVIFWYASYTGKLPF